MDYQTFLWQIRRLIESRVSADTQVKLHRVMKNNDAAWDTLLILKKGTEVSPIIYLGEYYRMYLNGSSLGEIADSILAQYRAFRVPPLDGLSDLKHYDTAQGHIVCRLVNRARNRRLLENTPHRDFLNLSVICCYLVDTERQEAGTVRITDEYMKMWDIDEAQLFADADANTGRLMPFEIRTIPEMLEELGADRMEVTCPPAPDMFVLSNRDKSFGAWWMTRREALLQMQRLAGERFFLLPSSVHECLAVPCRDDCDAQWLQQIVSEINRTQVAAEDVLADCVYEYDETKGGVMIAAGG